MGGYGSNKPVNGTKGSGIPVNQTNNNANATTQQGVVNQQNASGGSGGGCTGCEPNVPYITTLAEFVTILESLKLSIDKFFPSIGVGMSIEARMGVRGVIDIRHMARVQWISNNRDREGRFDVTNIRHIQLLKDEFLRMGVNWEIDTWLRNWTPTPAPVAGGNTVTGAPATTTRSIVVAT